MATKRGSMTRSRRALHRHHGHSKASCLKVLRRLSAYLDRELGDDLCKEIRRHLGICPPCEVFLKSLRQTIDLCRQAEAAPLSPAQKARLRSQLLKAASRC